MNMRPTGKAQVPRIVEGGLSSGQVPRMRNAIQSVGWTIERSMLLAWFLSRVKRQPVEMASQGTSPSKVSFTGPQDWLVTDMKYCCAVAGVVNAIRTAVKSARMVSGAPKFYRSSDITPHP